MTGAFSASLDAFRRIQDGVDPVEAEVPNDIMTAIETIERAVGLSPSSSSNTLNDRISKNIGDDGDIKAMSRGVVSTQSAVAFTEDFTSYGVPRCFALPMNAPDPANAPVILAWSTLASNTQTLEVWSTGGGGVPSTATDIAWLMWLPQT